MRKTWAISFILMMALPGFLKPVQLAAQDDNAPSIEIDWDDYNDDLYVRGDQTFIISLGTVFPVLFYNNGREVSNHKFNIIGGCGSLAYNYYITGNFFTGGEIGVMFLSTEGENTVFMIPLGVRAGYQFNIWRLEFPISAAIGMTWCRKLNDGYYGLYLRGGLAAFYRATYNWSFGISSNWYCFPQWTSDKTKDAVGNFIDLTLSARYLF